MTGRVDGGGSQRRLAAIRRPSSRNEVSRRESSYRGPDASYVLPPHASRSEHSRAMSRIARGSAVLSPRIIYPVPRIQERSTRRRPVARAPSQSISCEVLTSRSRYGQRRQATKKGTIDHETEEEGVIQVIKIEAMVMGPCE